MLFTILSARSKYKEAKEAVNDPAGFAKDTATGIISSYLISFAFTTLIILGGLGTLGYSTLLGGPYGFAKVIFWILIIMTVVTITIVSASYRFLKNQIKNQVQPKSNQSSDNIIDVEVN